MYKHEEKICPRCQRHFECKVGDVTKCQCYAVKLTDADREFISTQFSDCLCTACMRELAAERGQVQTGLAVKRAFGSR